MRKLKPTDLLFLEEIGAYHELFGGGLDGCNVHLMRTRSLTKSCISNVFILEVGVVCSDLILKEVRLSNDIRIINYLDRLLYDIQSDFSTSIS